MSVENQPKPQNEGFSWYVIRVYPGQERGVSEKIVERLRTQPGWNAGMQILVPVDVMVEETDSKKYLGYLVVKIRMRKDIWAVIMNTPGVTSFIGMGSRPTLFSQKDWTDIPFHLFSSYQ
jgi:transcription termination/antitermination protein NusG